jgi:hypothetical protein
MAFFMPVFGIEILQKNCFFDGSLAKPILHEKIITPELHALFLPECPR